MNNNLNFSTVDFVQQKLFIENKTIEETAKSLCEEINKEIKIEINKEKYNKR